MREHAPALLLALVVLVLGWFGYERWFGSDHGAELIRIEPPGDGDSFRSVHRIPRLAHSAHSCLWLQGACNRRSTVGVVARLRASAVVG